MTEFETILEANSKPPRTRRKPAMEPAESFFLDKVREVRVSLQNGLETLVVIEHKRSFEQVFLHYTPVMKLYARNGKLKIKTVDEVVAEDLECNIIELDKEQTK